MRIISIVPVLVFLSLSCFNLQAQTPPSTLPDFSFYTLDSKTFSAKDVIAGKKSLFVFFDANCDHCQRAVSHLGRRYSDLKATSIYMVSLDSKEVINKFMTSFGKDLKDKKNVRILQDLKYQFIPRFHPKRYPALFLYSGQKKLMLYTSDENEVDKVIAAAK